MAALLYFISAVVILGLTHRYFISLTRGAALALLLLPLCVTGRALLTDRIYAPVEMPYIAQPFGDHARELGVGRPHNGAISDIAFQMMPWREATRRALANREWPLLNAFELCGDVLAGGAQPAVFSPFTLIACILPTPLSFTYTGAIAFFIAGLGAFVFARELGCSIVASMFAAVGWMFSRPVALMILWPFGIGWALLPFVLAATHRLIHARGRRSVALLTVALSLEILTGHPETLLHVVAIGAAYGLFELQSVRGDRWRIMAAAAIAGGLALALTSIYLFPVFDTVAQASVQGIRQRYAQMPLWTPPGYSRELIVNDFVPWLRSPRAGLPEGTTSGSIVLALAIYAMCFVRARATLFFALLLAFGVLAGAQAWPVAQALHALPLFGQALNGRLATVVPLAAGILAAFAIDRFDRRRVAITFGALLVVYAIVAMIDPGPAFDVARLLAETVPLGVACAVLFVPRFSRAAFAALFVLVLVQRIVADGSLVPTNDPRIAYPRWALLRPMEQVGEPFRVAGKGGALLPNTATMYGFEDVRGHTPVTMTRLTETFPLWSGFDAGFHTIPDLSRPFLSMMNVRFALLDVSDPIPPGWRNVTYEIYTRLIENEHVLARAFVPRTVRIGLPRQQVLDEMAAETDFGQRAWLAIDDRPHERTNGSGEISTRRANLGLEMDVTKHGDGFVVISEAAWNGWRAYLDGKRVSVHRANHAFLSVFVPEGHHTVVLRYMPRSFVVGRAITFLTLALIVIVSALSRKIWLTPP
ncbi:MAG: YfhO family protein [Thermoanaerobaculia bacterium]